MGLLFQVQFDRGEELKDGLLGGSGAGAAADAISNLHAPTAGPQSASAETREEEPGGRGERTLQTPAPCRLPHGRVSLMAINGRQQSVRFLINPRE